MMHMASCRAQATVGVWVSAAQYGAHPGYKVSAHGPLQPPREPETLPREYGCGGGPPPGTSCDPTRRPRQRCRTVDANDHGTPRTLTFCPSLDLNRVHAKMGILCGWNFLIGNRRPAIASLGELLHPVLVRVADDREVDSLPTPASATCI